jgi:hypothetical protein
VTEQNGKEPLIIRTKPWSALMLAFTTWSVINRVRMLLHPRPAAASWTFTHFGLPPTVETVLNLAIYGLFFYALIEIFRCTERRDEKILMVCAFGGILYRPLLFKIWPESVAPYYVAFAIALAASLAALSLFLYNWKHKASADSAPSL